MKKDIIKRKRDLPSKIYFEVISKLENRIRITKKYWNVIIHIKHPSIKGAGFEPESSLEAKK